MKRVPIALLLFTFCVASATAQEKGVDQSSQRVRDAGANRTAGENGTRQDVGAGPGINFGKGKTPTVRAVPNPYRVAARRDAVIKATQEVMRDRKLVLDEAASRLEQGLIVSQPYTFIKGAVVAGPELTRYANLPQTTSRAWTRGRYTILVEIQPIDGISTNISVNAKIEGRTDGASGAEWVTLDSTGQAEQDFLSALVENITGVNPASPTP